VSSPHRILPGLVSVTFRKLSPAEIVALARRVGLVGIEWGGDIHAPHGDVSRAREVRELTLEAGLRVAAYGSYYRAGGGNPDNPDFARVLDSAVALGAPTIRVWPGGAGSAKLDAAGRARVVDDLLRIAELAAPAGVSISTEFHDGTLTDTNDSARRLLAEVPHPNLSTYWQPHNGEPTPDCVAGLRAVLPRVSNVHVFHWWPTAAERHPLAAGAERWAAFFRELSALPGERFALLEFVRGDTEAALVEDAATLREWLAAPPASA
jgi:3-dehydroshikimate dehydratase